MRFICVVCTLPLSYALSADPVNLFKRCHSLDHFQETILDQGSDIFVLHVKEQLVHN